MSIKIIGAGLPRTGTNTLKQSLEQLGYKHVYHMKELLVNPDKLHLWKTLDETGDTDWDALYEGYDGTVDFPGYPWYKEHMKQYPDAKVILTVRDFDAWYKSVDSTGNVVKEMRLPQRNMMISHYHRKRPRYSIPDIDFLTSDTLVEIFNRYEMPAYKKLSKY